MSLHDHGNHHPSILQLSLRISELLKDWLVYHWLLIHVCGSRTHGSTNCRLKNMVLGKRITKGKQSLEKEEGSGVKAEGNHQNILFGSAE